MITKYTINCICILLAVILIIVVVCLPSSRSFPSPKLTSTPSSCSVAVLYCYYEKNELYRNNFQYFLKHGLSSPNPNIHYFIAINGKCTVPIPSDQRIHVFHRENRGYDFGGWSHLLSQIGPVEYEYYFFINTSVCGPYGDNKADWVDSFIDLFTSPNVKVVGTSINVYRPSSYDKHNLEDIYDHPAPFPHVQSMFFGIDRQYKNYLTSVGFFDEERYNSMSFSDLIVFAEIGLSQLAIRQGWNINCILPEYRGRDYRTIRDDPNWSSNNGDPYYPGCYFGKTIRKEDAVFFKSWRLK